MSNAYINDIKKSKGLPE